jgi:hypothetical protein
MGSGLSTKEVCLSLVGRCSKAFVNTVGKEEPTRQKGALKAKSYPWSQAVDPTFTL